MKPLHIISIFVITERENMKKKSPQGVSVGVSFSKAAQALLQIPSVSSPVVTMQAPVTPGAVPATAPVPQPAVTNPQCPRPGVSKGKDIKGK